MSRSDVERQALTIATASGRHPTSPEARALVAVFRWSFGFLVRQAGAHGSDPVTCSVLRDAAETLLFRHGEAAFDRALSPLVAGVLAVGGNHTDWAWLLGLSRTDMTTALELTSRVTDGTPSPGELLRASRHVLSGRLDTGQP